MTYIHDLEMVNNKCSNNVSNLFIYVADGLANRDNITNKKDADILCNNGIADKTYKLCPDKKFFSADNPYSTHEDDIDREWLSDDIFMRYESMYLIAAEAALRLNNLSESAGYLKEITSRRINHDDPDAANDYAKFEAKLSNEADLTNAVILNWRIEMWGEGYGLETFRRWYQYPRTRGGNHDYAPGKTIKATESSYNMQIPSSESTYNPNVKE